jgi:GNAT superfamily N-acetyltransferase
VSIAIRPVRPDDEQQWSRLYAGYRAFYRLEEDPGAVATTWGWVIGGQHGLRGLVAVDDADRPIALANLRVFARPSSASIGLYLDDLFAAPEARGRGAASALIERAAALAAEEGMSVVRWITAEDNATARRVYDRLAAATPWVTYDLRPRPGTVEGPR